MSANTSEPTHCPAPDNTGPNISDERDISFGTHIESLAAYWGVHPVDAAIGIAGVLTNITGPYAGLVDPLGSRIQPHLNLIKLNNSSPGWSAMERALFQPLQARSDYLRKRASSQSRQLVDRWCFGEHDPQGGERITNPMLQDLNGQGAQCTEYQTAMLKQSGLPPRSLDVCDLSDPYNYPVTSSPDPSAPGASHLPSFYFKGINLEQMEVILKESLHRQALVQNPTGGLFSPNADLTTKDDKLAAELASLLGGRDQQFAPIHRDQGYGTFEMTRLYLWASTTSDRLGQVLDQNTSSWLDVLTHCLVWEPSRSSKSKLLTRADAAAYKAYQALVHDLLDRRCFGNIRQQDLRRIPDQAISCFVARQDAYLDMLDGIPSPDRAFVEQFHDLPARLLWVFLHFGGNDKPWRMQAAFKTAEHAARMQVRLIQRARDEHANKKLQQGKLIVMGILTRKGPCKLRGLQRSSNNRKADFLRPALQELKKEGRLTVDAEKRFKVIGQQ
jgi:hypothetical protein